LRVLYITGAAVPGSSAESVRVIETASNLVELGHRVDLLTDRAAGQRYKEIIGGVKIMRAHMRTRGRVVPILAARRIAHFFRRRFDVIVEQYDALGGLGAALSVLKNIPLVLDVSHPHREEILSHIDHPGPITNGGLYLLSRIQFGRASLALATCPELLPEAAREKGRIAEWGINTERFSPELRRAAMCEHLKRVHDLRGRVVVAFHGPLDDRHGAPHLADIFERVLAAGLDARFLVVGNGPRRAELQAQCRQRGMISKVVFAGDPPYHERPNWLAAADVAVAPFEVSDGPLSGFGLYWPLTSLCELMACGAAPVSTQYPRTKALLAEGRGILASPGRLQELADGIVRLGKDKEMSRAMGERAARYIAENLDSEKCGRTIQEALLEAAANAPPRFKFF
jgi:glycosyltransferase involved in cell wall biosynthesis